MEIASTLNSVSTYMTATQPVSRVSAGVADGTPAPMVNYLQYAAPVIKVEPNDGVAYLVMRDAVTGKIHQTISPPVAAAVYERSAKTASQQQRPQPQPHTGSGASGQVPGLPKAASPGTVGEHVPGAGTGTGTGIGQPQQSGAAQSAAATSPLPQQGTTQGGTRQGVSILA
ncbi:MAG: hypothetical protein HQL37_01140 [Alphaproteobacteria bacterium]|nr:hypothetical protein [Alphaproteobacteria bacterium]